MSWSGWTPTRREPGARVTMYHMAAEREHVTIRLGTTGLAKLRELAADETEGNLSQMTRKLLREALDARAKR